MSNIIFSMIAFAFVGAITPGPVNLLATTTALNFGSRAAIKHVSGAALSYALVVFISGSLLQTVLEVLPGLEGVMQFLGSLFLIYLGYRIFSAPVTVLQSSHTRGSGFITGSLTQLLNPKAWMVAISGVSLYVVGQENENQVLIIFTVISFVICWFGVGVWALLGKVLAKYLENPTQQRNFNRGVAIVLVIAVVMMWL